MWITCCVLILLLPWNVVQQGLKKELLLTSPRGGFTSIELDGKIYFAGGFTNGNRASSTIDVFDIATQTWNNTLSLPSPRGFVTPAVVPPHIYFVGGWDVIFATTPYLYDSQSISLIAMPKIPMQQPIQMSIYGTTLTVLGSNTAMFLDLTKVESGWSTVAKLDSLMERIAGAAVFSHDNWIFIIGGVNVSSRQLISDAWVFDIETSNLTRYTDVIEPIGYLQNSEYTFSITNEIVAVRTKPSALASTCILFDLATSTWFDLTANTTSIFSVPGFTLMFTLSGYYTVDWSNPRADPIFSNATGPIVYSVGFANSVAYFVNTQLTVEMHCMTDGVWTTRYPGVPNISTVIATLEWSSTGAVFATPQGIYLFNNCSLNFVALQPIQSMVVSHPVADQLYVAVQTSGSNSSLHRYDATLAYLGSIDVPLVPEACFDNILFQFRFMKAFSLTTLSVPSTMYTGSFDARAKWTSRGQFFVALSVDSAAVKLSDQVDIYNYKTNEWLNSTSHPAIAQIAGFSQAFKMDDALTIFISDKLLRFDVTSYSWVVQTLNESVSLPANLSPMALEVNGTIYATLNIMQLRTVSHGTIALKLITDQEIPLQMVYNTKFNQLFITTTKNTIYTFNIDNQQKDIFLYPKADTEILMATSGGFFVVSAYYNIDALDYCDLSTSQWYSVPGVANHIRPASMHGLSFDGRDLVVVAGGIDKEYQYFTDSVKILYLSPPETPAIVPVMDTAPTASPVQQDNSTLIVAVVVPVGAVIIAGALLAFFLIRRQKKRKNKRGNRMSTIGLEQQYGQWFIPFSDLTFHEQLGQGGSGQVFKGSWKNTLVALKLSMTQAHSSVISELALMMQLRPHPNVVQLLGFSVHLETDSIVLVLEYCNGGALDELLFNDKTTVTMKQKLEWLIGISKGLSHLHSNNIVHRDVAARNVLLHQNEAKITDFGMSRIVDDQQQRGTTKSELGPIRWMSPESLSRKEYSVKSDVWSFGIVAYEIITQQEPHLDRDPIQVGQEIRDSGLTPQLPDTCPSDLASVIKSCWNMEPSQRPTFEQLIAQLDNITNRPQN